MTFDNFLEYYKHKITSQMRIDLVEMVMEDRIRVAAEGIRAGEANERRRIQVRLFDLLIGKD